MAVTDLQHTSPCPVWQSLLAWHGFGHSLAGMQIAFL
jgi:hypothetical protein